MSGNAQVTPNWNDSNALLYPAKYLGNDWNEKLGISDWYSITAILGKWRYYLGNGNFPNTPAGRQAAAPVIAQDLWKSVQVKYSDTSIYNVLQAIAAGLNRAQQGIIPNPVVTAANNRGILDNVSDNIDAIEEKAQNVVSSISVPSWMKWAAGGILGLGVYAGIKHRIGGR